MKLFKGHGLERGGKSLWRIARRKVVALDWAVLPRAGPAAGRAHRVGIRRASVPSIHDGEHADADFENDAVVFVHGFLPTGTPPHMRASFLKVDPGKNLADYDWGRELRGASAHFERLVSHPQLRPRPRYIISFSSAAKLFDIADVVKTALWDIAITHARVTVVAHSFAGYLVGLALLDDVLLDSFILSALRLVCVDVPWHGLSGAALRWIGNTGWWPTQRMLVRLGEDVASTPFAAFARRDATSVLSQAMVVLGKSATHVLCEALELCMFAAFPDDYSQHIIPVHVQAPYVDFMPSEVRGLVRKGILRLDASNVCVISLAHLGDEGAPLFEATAPDGRSARELFPGAMHVRMPAERAAEDAHRYPVHRHHFLDLAVQHALCFANDRIIEAVATFSSITPFPSATVGLALPTADIVDDVDE
jgi:hypothetical protein